MIHVVAASGARRSARVSPSALADGKQPLSERAGLVRKTYEFRLRPTKAQEKRLMVTLEACRSAYNWALEDRKTLWDYCKVSTGFYDQCSYVKHLRVERPLLQEVHTHLIQDSLKRLDLAFRRFFLRVKAGKPGYPRFKASGSYKSFMFKDWGNGARFDDKRLLLWKIGRVRIVMHRPIEGEIKTCAIKRRADGWYALFSVEAVSWRSIVEYNPTGIDVGLLDIVALSDGSKVENPRFGIHAEREIVRAQRVVARRKRGSERRRKAVRHLALEYQRLVRRRTDFQFKLARSLVRQFNPIFVEDLNVEGLTRNSRMTGHIRDAAWSRFREILSRSAESAGVAVTAVEAHGTSQVCSGCGRKVFKTLAVRVHRCECGLVIDRDVNAARNILAKGLGRPFGEGSGSRLVPMIRETAQPKAAAECHGICSHISTSNLR